MKTDSLIEANNQLRKKLDPENRKYYEDLLRYIRGKSIVNRETDVEQLLLDILHDLIDAQTNGQSAKAYFGKDPQVLADAILQTLPKSFFEVLKLACYIVVGYVLLFTIPTIISPTAVFDLGNLIIEGTTAFIFSLGILWLIGQETYQKSNLKKFALYTIGVLVYIGIIIGGIFIKTPLSVSLTGWWGIGTILVLLTITTMIYIAERKRLPFLIIVYIMILIDALLGIGTRTPGLSEFLTKPIVPKPMALWILIPGCIIAALIGGFGTWFYLKRKDR
ncbi:hypothetical protein [Lentilactobacillus hilgardii]|uniref:hypothetical protein n=1 Tax=Lentilactobacillus hilgardii TaxID=1588 RepID=UPI0021A3C68B|nr:hypothetical protein [Lentilactobacillus hilgardii]MCT3395923.1 hypothetical protein [Lentilactobacillus hilgardii]